MTRGKRGMGAGLFLELSHSQVLFAAPPNELVRLVLLQLFEMPNHRGMHVRRDRLMIRVGAAAGLRDNLVDYLELEQIGGGDTKRSRGLLAHFRTLAVLP